MLAAKSILAIFACICLKSVSAQVQVNCEFGNAEVLGRTSYACTVNNLIANFTTSTVITIGGQHLAGQEDASVNILRINGATINRFPNTIFNVFRNIEAVEVTNSGSFDLTQAFLLSGNLLAIRLVNNTLPVLPFAFFSNTPNVERLDLNHNGIADLGFAPFFGTRLSFLSIERNQIRDLPENLFNNLITLGEVHFANNWIESLSGNLFRDNPALRVAGFSNNNINSIGPDFLNALPNLSTLNLAENACIDEDFVIDGVTTRPIIIEALQVCFNNSATEPPPRSGTVLTLEVVGNLRIIDADGNEILNVSG